MNNFIFLYKLGVSRRFGKSRFACLPDEVKNDRRVNSHIPFIIVQLREVMATKKC